MIKPIGNREKRIALLLTVAFAWLFIGSLIVFHEEHVLGKHFNLCNQLFISPKSNDKPCFHVKQVKTAVKLFENSGFAGNLVQYSYTSINCLTGKIKPGRSLAIHADDDILTLYPLRAPPAI